MKFFSQLKKVAIIGFSFGLLCSAHNVNAEQRTQSDSFYGGLGLSDTSSTVQGLDGDATGFNVFLGHTFAKEWIRNTALSVEAGYLSTENFDWDTTGEASSADGSWASGVMDFYVTNRFNVLGRVGYDFGDDEGPLYGLGAGFSFKNGFALRAEYIERDEIESIQLNAVMKVTNLFF